MCLPHLRIHTCTQLGIRGTVAILRIVLTTVLAAEGVLLTEVTDMHPIPLRGTLSQQ